MLFGRLRVPTRYIAPIGAAVVVAVITVSLSRGSRVDAVLPEFPPFAMTYEERSGGDVVVHELQYRGPNDWQDTVVSSKLMPETAGTYERASNGNLTYHSGRIGNDIVRPIEGRVVPAYWLGAGPDWHLRRGAAEVAGGRPEQVVARYSGERGCPPASPEVGSAGPQTIPAPAGTGPQRCDPAGQGTYIEEFVFDRATGIPLSHRTISDGTVTVERVVTRLEATGSAPR